VNVTVAIDKRQGIDRMRLVLDRPAEIEASGEAVVGAAFEHTETLPGRKPRTVRRRRPRQPFVRVGRLPHC
jgi:hypothetical protein